MQNKKMSIPKSHADSFRLEEIVDRIEDEEQASSRQDSVNKLYGQPLTIVTEQEHHSHFNQLTTGLAQSRRPLTAKRRP